MKRHLFVFSGQSNMMGAAVFNAREQIYFKSSFEYLHINLDEAYSNDNTINGKSKLENYSVNTYFCPSLTNLDKANKSKTTTFDVQCEADDNCASSLAPFIIKGLEEQGFCTAFAHIAKGRVPIKHFLVGKAADYFNLKVTDFFFDSERYFKEEIGEKILVWLQGESDATNGYEPYLNSLRALWQKAKGLGFTKFLIIRVGFWGNEKIAEIMKAQEDFCKAVKDAYIITRACSFMKHPLQSDIGWIIDSECDDFLLCRDSFYGFRNHHINEKGFKTIAKYAVPNIVRILNGKKPILEQERIIPLKGSDENE